MTETEATLVVEMMTGIPFFPSARGAQALIGDELALLCPTAQDGVWLATRAIQLCQKWAGITVIYQIWFSKHNPKNPRERELDRLSGSTEAYPDGVPSENQSYAQLAGPQMKALAAGEAVSADPKLDRLVVDLAAGMQPELRTPEELGAEAKAAHPELAGMEDKHIGLKLLAKARRDEKRVDRELRAMFHMPEEERRA